MQKAHRSDFSLKPHMIDTALTPLRPTDSLSYEASETMKLDWLSQIGPMASNRIQLETVQMHVYVCSTLDLETLSQDQQFVESPY